MFRPRWIAGQHGHIRHEPVRNECLRNKRQVGVVQQHRVNPWYRCREDTVAGVVQRAHNDLGELVHARLDGPSCVNDSLQSILCIGDELRVCYWRKCGCHRDEQIPGPTTLTVTALPSSDSLQSLSAMPLVCLQLCPELLNNLELYPRGSCLGCGDESFIWCSSAMGSTHYDFLFLFQ